MPVASLLISAALAAVGVPDRYPEALAQRFPHWAAANGRSVYASLDVAVRPDGTMMACRGAEWDGSKRFADQACSLVWHIILEPARDAEGVAVHGRRRLQLKFVTPGHEGSAVAGREQLPEFTVPVAQRLESDQSADLQVNVLVGTDGTVGTCEPSSDMMLASQAISDICNVIRAKRRTEIRDKDKQPVVYVDQIKVRLDATGARGAG